MPLIKPSVINAFNYDTADQMHEAICNRLVFGTTFKDRDWSEGPGVGLTNVCMGCRSFVWQFDLARYWLTMNRWKIMVRQYIDPDALASCLALVGTRMKKGGTGVAAMRTNLVKGSGTGTSVRRRWGSCMLSLSFMVNPRPTVTLRSRTTYFGYLSVFDVTVARVFAKMCCEQVGVKIEDVQFVWTLDLAQFHGFRSLAWATGNDVIRRRMDKDRPNRLKISAKLEEGNELGYRKLLDWYQRILGYDDIDKKYGDEKYHSFNRTRRRLHMEVFGPKYAQRFAGGTLDNIGPIGKLPSISSDDLDFSCLGGGRIDDDEPEEEDDDE